MTYILLPDNCRTNSMLPDCDDRHWLNWTRQPGGDGMMHVGIEGVYDGPIPESITKSIEQARDDTLPTPLAPNKESGDRVKIALRDYQSECIEAIQQSWNEGARKPLVVLPTGAGKTIIAASLMEDSFGSRGHRSVFLAHRKELITQTVEKIHLVSRSFTPRVGVLQGSSNELGKDITVASIQTLGGSRSKKRLQQFLDAGPYQILICDEAHHAVSSQWLRVINAMNEAFPDLRMFGMTATPGRADGTALDTVFDRIVFERNLIDMIQMGYLVPPKGYHVSLGLNLDQVGTNNGDFVQSQLSKVMNQSMVNRSVVEAWRGYGMDRKTIVFCVDVAHATALTQEFNDAGYTSEVIYGAMKTRDRNAAIGRFRTGETKLLLNCEIATEGFDEPSIECVLFARPTQSQALYVQCLGRGLRLYPRKTECIVLDCVGNSGRHRMIQLATLAGFDPEKKAGTGGGGDGDGGDDPMVVPTVVGSTVTGSEVDLTRSRASTKWPWVETQHGWVLQIPRIGYYMVAWASKSKTQCMIRFYDQRPGRRKSPPVDIVSSPIDFMLAYGLVEAEMERIFAARASRSMVRTRNGSYEDPSAEDKEFNSPDRPEDPNVSFVDLDEGTDEQLDIPDHLMLKEADWRTRDTTNAQRALLKKLGVKEKTMPEKAGEASDLITILRIEKDAKMRVPATTKQMAYLRYNDIEFSSSLTKGQAATLIWQHRKATGR